MIILSHRGFWKTSKEKNSIKAFKRALSSGFGVELDLRDYNGSLVVSHDIPKDNSTLFEYILIVYNECSGILPLAVNIKSDGLLKELKRLIRKYNINNYFIFDMSIPEMLRYNNANLKYFTRLSEFETEPIMLADAAGIWLDAFERVWYDKIYINKLLHTADQVCIVSAELHNRDHANQWALIKELDDQKKIMLCTDKPNEAREYFG